MEQIIIPTAWEIATMSWEGCQYMRIRLKNEISFARGNEAMGGGSSEEAVAVQKCDRNDRTALAPAGKHRRGRQSRGGSGCSTRGPFPGVMVSACRFAKNSGCIEETQTCYLHRLTNRQPH